MYTYIKGLIVTCAWLNTRGKNTTRTANLKVSYFRGLVVSMVDFSVLLQWAISV